MEKRKNVFHQKYFHEIFIGKVCERKFPHCDNFTMFALINGEVQIQLPNENSPSFIPTKYEFRLRFA